MRKRDSAHLAPPSTVKASRGYWFCLWCDKTQVQNRTVATKGTWAELAAFNCFVPLLCAHQGGLGPLKGLGNSYTQYWKTGTLKRQSLRCTTQHTSFLCSEPSAVTMNTSIYLMSLIPTGKWSSVHLNCRVWGPGLENGSLLMHRVETEQWWCYNTFVGYWKCALGANHGVRNQNTSLSMTFLR